MTSKITIADVAEALDVSPISVSRALSGQNGVSKELRDTILVKAKEMGYSKCKNKDEYNILVLHQKPYIHDNSNFSYMVQGIEIALQNAGLEYDIEFIDKEKQNQKTLPCKLTKEKKFDGIIFIGRFNNDYVNFLKEKVISHIFYTGYNPSYDCDSVWYNFNNIGYKLCEYLINKGHKDIGYLGCNSLLFRNKEMVLGITSALEDYEISSEKQYFFYVEDNFEDNLEDTVKVLINSDNRPSAIICQLDFLALKLIKLLYKYNIRVPEDISIVGSGNTEMSSLSLPSLTTMDLNIEYSCEAAVNLLLRRINNSNKPNECITINGILIERDSVKVLI